MQNEIENQLKHINKQIANINNGELESEKLLVSGEDFVDGYLEALLEQKEWLESLIINFD
jgi:hypothetical protein